MSKKLQITILCLSAIVFFALGYLASYRISYTVGWNAAKQRVANSGLVPLLPVNAQVENVYGTIQSVVDSKITVKIRPVDVFANSSLDTRVIDVTNDTKIYNLEQVDQQTYMVEMSAYIKKMQATGTSSTTPIAPPSPFAKTEISLPDLKVGDGITVNAGSNIRNAEEFSAAEIDVNPTATSASPSSVK